MTVQIPETIHDELHAAARLEQVEAVRRPAGEAAMMDAVLEPERLRREKEAARLTEVSENNALINGLLDTLPGSDRMDGVNPTLEDVRAVEANVFWGQYGEPHYIIGKKEIHDKDGNNSETELLLAKVNRPYSIHTGPLDRNVHKLRLDAAELKAAQQAVASVKGKPFTQNDVKALLWLADFDGTQTPSIRPDLLKFEEYNELYKTLPMLQQNEEGFIKYRNKNRAEYSVTKGIHKTKKPEYVVLDNETMEEYGVEQRLHDIAIDFRKANVLLGLLPKISQMSIWDRFQPVPPKAN